MGVLSEGQIHFRLANISFYLSFLFKKKFAAGNLLFFKVFTNNGPLTIIITSKATELLMKDNRELDRETNRISLY